MKQTITSPINREIRSLDQFKADLAKRGEFQTRSPVAVVARLGGSGIDLALTGLHADFSPEVFDLDFSSADKSEAINVLFDIFNFIAAQAKDLGQKVLPITLGTASFETSEQPNKFKKSDTDKALPDQLGLHCFANYNLGLKGLELDEEASQHQEASRLVNFWNLINSKHSDMSIKYDDGKQTASLNRGDFMVDYRIMNDTVAIAASTVDGLNKGENTLGMVCGSGFNIGLAETYSPEIASFQKFTNTESGHNRIAGEYLSPLDKWCSDPTVEKVFAAGNKGVEDKGIRKELEYLRELNFNQERVYADLTRHLQNYDSRFKLEDIKDSSLIKSNEIPTNIEIVQAAKDGDRLARALSVSLVARLGRYIANEIPLSQSGATTRIGITGSHFLDLLEVDRAEEAFLSSINEKRSEPLEIVRFKRDQMDGLKSYVQSQAKVICQNNLP